MIAHFASLLAAGLDPVAGAGAVLALAAAVTVLTVKAIYNKEQVKILGRRVRNITPIVQVCTDHSQLSVP
jgi:hypothetical protein